PARTGRRCRFAWRCSLICLLRFVEKHRKALRVADQMQIRQSVRHQDREALRPVQRQTDDSIEQVRCFQAAKRYAVLAARCSLLAARCSLLAARCSLLAAIAAVASTAYRCSGKHCPFDTTSRSGRVSVISAENSLVDPNPVTEMTLLLPPTLGKYFGIKCRLQFHVLLE